MLTIIITALVVSLAWFILYAKLDHKYQELKRHKQPRFGVSYLNEYVTGHEWYDGKMVESWPVRVGAMPGFINKASKSKTYTFWF